VVVSLLSGRRRDIQAELPPPGDEILVATNGRLGCPEVLFVGVPPLRQFSYEQIRSFGRRVLRSLAAVAPHTKHLSLTIHGPGYGLDEAEAFRAEIAGLVDAITYAQYPPNLRTITFVEREEGRARRLNGILEGVLPRFSLDVADPGSPEDLGPDAGVSLRSAGAGSKEKRHVFVAMPFLDEMSDLFTTASSRRSRLSLRCARERIKRSSPARS